MAPRSVGSRDAKRIRRAEAWRAARDGHMDLRLLGQVPGLLGLDHAVLVDRVHVDRHETTSRRAFYSPALLYRQ